MSGQRELNSEGEWPLQCGIKTGISFHAVRILGHVLRALARSRPSPPNVIIELTCGVELHTVFTMKPVKSLAFWHERIARLAISAQVSLAKTSEPHTAAAALVYHPSFPALERDGCRQFRQFIGIKLMRALYQRARGRVEVISITRLPDAEPCPLHFVHMLGISHSDGSDSRSRAVSFQADDVGLRRRLAHIKSRASDRANAVFSPCRATTTPAFAFRPASLVASVPAMEICRALMQSSRRE
jgi:hypothetical protein